MPTSGLARLPTARMLERLLWWAFLECWLR